ncbi:MAG TPA: phytoene desaturase family protein [Dyadobacter sp.]|jgi:phytoene desaturase|nr:phytoene desaturase family protein [Dyadobacter sp.]
MKGKTIGQPRAKVAVIGSGFAGMAAASILAIKGTEVTVFEKNDTTGGRARTFSKDGFTFDMGPSWYWMPDVYEKFYNLFGKTTSDFYELKKLDPGFAVVFPGDEVWDIPADFDQVCDLFEGIEAGAGDKLRKFIADGEFKYEVGMNKMVYKPGHSVTEFFSLSLLRDAVGLDLFTSFSKFVRRYFKDPRLLALIEFPVLFLGAMPKDTPALYSLMNFSGLKQGTFYPMGGFGEVAKAFEQIAMDSGVRIRTSEKVGYLEVTGSNIHTLHSNGRSYKVDAVVGSADYEHIESTMLHQAYRSYPPSYWESRTFAPSCLLFYLGINKKINKLRHHNLFFDESFELHAEEIYKDKKWPTKPLFYVCCPSRTDDSVAPQGCENLFVLMPIAIGLVDSEEIRAEYFEKLMDRLERFAEEDIRPHITYKRSYAKENFVQDYNAYQGNAYGLANTLMQTAIFKPKMKSKKVGNLYYAGQLTVPGPGVPPSIISGRIAATELLKSLKGSL